MCFRCMKTFVAAIDEAAGCRGWTRTTWILYWLGKGLDHDRGLFGLTPDEAAADRAKRAREVERVRQWRGSRSKGKT